MYNLVWTLICEHISYGIECTIFKILTIEWAYGHVLLFNETPLPYLLVLQYCGIFQNSCGIIQNEISTEVRQILKLQTKHKNVNKFWKINNDPGVLKINQLLLGPKSNSKQFEILRRGKFEKVKFGANFGQIQCFWASVHASFASC